jgi:hypothetical protein
MVDDATDRERNLVRAAQRLLGAPHVRRDGVQLLLGSVEQFAALARPLLCEQRIAADHEALARIVGRGDLGKVALIRQRELDGAHLDQAADRRHPQGGIRSSPAGLTVSSSGAAGDRHWLAPPPPPRRSDARQVCGTCDLKRSSRPSAQIGRASHSVKLRSGALFLRRRERS